MKLPLFAAFALYALPVSAGSYFCSGTLSAGFRLDGDQWRSVVFNTEGDQFTVSSMKPLAEGDFDYKVTRLGEDSPLHLCHENPINIVCGGQLQGFIVNKGTMRFQMIYGIGFVDAVGGNNTPAITAGMCSALD